MTQRKGQARPPPAVAARTSWRRFGPPNALARRQGVSAARIRSQNSAPGPLLHLAACPWPQAPRRLLRPPIVADRRNHCDHCALLQESGSRGDERVRLFSSSCSTGLSETYGLCWGGSGTTPRRFFGGFQTATRWGSWSHSCGSGRVSYRIPQRATRGGEMAKVVLWGDTAMQWHAHAVRPAGSAASIGQVLPHALRPTAGVASYLAERLPFLPRPYHVAVFRPEDRRILRDMRCHVAAPSVLSAPHWRIASGVFAPAPELALLELARGRELPEVAAAAAALCSTYALRLDGALVERRPLTSPASIRAACEAHGDLPGCGVVARSLPWLAVGAASPREAALALVLSLPGRFGGYGLPVPMLNKPLSVGDRKRNLADCAHYVADLCWPASQLVVEYDSDEYHLTSRQQRHDAVRRMVLEEVGYRVVSVTRLQLNDPREMDKVAKVVAAALGRRLRIRCRDFRRKQSDLWVAVGLPRPAIVLSVLPAQ